MEVVQIIEQRLEELQQKAEDITLSRAERCEAVFEMVAIKKAANKNKFKELLKNIFALVDGM